MKEKVIVHIITGLNNGGAEAVLFRLVTHDSLNKHLVISMMNEGKYGFLLEEDGIQVFYLNMPRGRITWRGIKSLWTILSLNKPDVVQTWMYHADLVGGIIARLVGIKNVVWGIRNSTLLSGSTSRLTLIISKICAVLSYVIPRKIITCAKNAMEVHVEQGYCPSKFHVVPNGYDLNQFKPDSVARKKMRLDWEMSENLRLIGMVARFDPQKDISNLLDALVKLKGKVTNFHCLLIGNGMDLDNESLNQLIFAKEMGDYVSPLGSHNDIPAVMNALDIHILSSKFGEAFPNVLAEAMACGTPCIATDVGDANIIINNTGWIVPPQSPQSLSTAIMEALELNQEREAWGLLQQRCRNHIVENFSIDRMVNAYHSVWTNINCK